MMNSTKKHRSQPTKDKRRARRPRSTPGTQNGSHHDQPRPHPGHLPHHHASLVHGTQGSHHHLS